MERFKTLLKLNIKRAYKSLFQLVLGAIALIFLVSAIAFYGTEYLYGGTYASTKTSDNNSSDTSVPMFKLGVVMYDSSTLAGTVTDRITNMSQISDTVGFIFIDEENAMNMLEQGKIMAVLIIPEDTVDGILHGKNKPMQVVFPENSGFEAILLKEVADAAATLLSSAQAGIYSIYDFYDEHDATTHKKDAVNRMNLKYINFTATGMNMFDREEVSATGQIPLMTYYISGALVLFILLLGMNCYSFINRMTPDVAKKLSLSGCPLILQGLSDYIAIVLVMLTAIAVIIAPAILIMNIFGMSLSIAGIFALLLILPVFVLLSSSLIYLISQLTLHNMSRIIITFFISLFMSFISGCFIPYIMLPNAVQFISIFLPARHMMDMSASLLSGSFDIVAFCICLVYTIVLLVFSIICSHIRLKKELK